MSDKSKLVLGCTFLALLVPFAIFKAYAFALVWGWFLSDYYGVREITTLHALGLLWALNYATANFFEKHETKDLGTEDISRMIGMGICGPIFFIAISWVILNLAF